MLKGLSDVNKSWIRNCGTNIFLDSCGGLLHFQNLDIAEQAPVALMQLNIVYQALLHEAVEAQRAVQKAGSTSKESTRQMQQKNPGKADLCTTAAAASILVCRALASEYCRDSRSFCQSYLAASPDFPFGCLLLVLC